MFNPLTMLTGNPWVYAAVGGVGILIGAATSGYVVNAIDQNTIKDQKNAAVQRQLDEATGLLKQYVGDADRIHAGATAFGNIQVDLSSQFASIDKDFKDALGKKALPLPLNCKPDPVRLQFLSSAVAAANKARTAGPVTGSGLPTHP